MIARHFSRTTHKIRSAVGHLEFHRTPLDVPLAVFFLMLFVGMWTAYSGQLALYKFWMLTAAIGLYYIITAVPRRYAWWLAAVCGPLAAGLALYYVTASGWHRGMAVLGGVLPPFYTLLSLRMFWPLFLPHPNVIGGLIAMLMPFMAATWLYARREGRQTWLLVTAVCLVIALGGLLVTRSVAAWLALAAGLGLWAMWPISGWWSQRWPLRRGVCYGLLTGVIISGGLTFIWWVIKMGMMGSEALMRSEALVGRFTLVRGAWRLVQDYSWTGSGLASFPALYAEYVRVVPNFFVGYSNVYLDVWLELGVIGLAAVLAVWWGALWQVIQALRRSLKRPYPAQGNVYWLRWAALSSLMIMMLRGITDDMLFGGLAGPLLFFMPAMAVLVSRRQHQTHRASSRGLFLAGAAVVGLFTLGALLLTLSTQAQAAWQANQGALLMDRVLLPGWPQNEWRESRYTTVLQPAKMHFEQALTLDASNRTAHQRLGMMALLERDFKTAVFHLEQAYQQDPHHQGIIKQLGYAYVWQGQLERALPLLVDTPGAASEMEIYIRWWQGQHRPELAEQAAMMLTLLEGKSPD